MEQKYIDIIHEYYKDNLTVAAATSLLYIRGLEGMRYMEVRKVITKEFQRLDDNPNKENNYENVI